MTSDTIEIKQLALDAYIGVYEWEQKIKQEIVLDIWLTLPTGMVSRAAQHDRLEDTLDYTAVVACVQACVAESPHQLIETLAENIAQQLLGAFLIEAVELCIYKQAALSQAASVGLRIQRKKQMGF